MIAAGGYAVVGAAAMAAARTVSTSVIVFELTGSLHILPVLVASARGVGNALNLSIYDTMMKLNNLQYQPLPPHKAAGRTAADVMDAQVVAVSSRCPPRPVPAAQAGAPRVCRHRHLRRSGAGRGDAPRRAAGRAAAPQPAARRRRRVHAGLGPRRPQIVATAAALAAAEGHLGTLHRHLETLRSPVALPLCWTAHAPRLRRGPPPRDETSDDQRYRTPAPGTAEEAAPAPEAVVVGGDGAAAAAEFGATPAEARSARRRRTRRRRARGAVRRAVAGESRCSCSRSTLASTRPRGRALGDQPSPPSCSRARRCDGAQARADGPRARLRHLRRPAVGRDPAVAADRGRGRVARFRFPNGTQAGERGRTSHGQRSHFCR